MTSSYCPSCLEPDTGWLVCPHCGWSKTDVPGDTIYLRPGTVLASPYQIARVLGHGGFGITYLGLDVNLQIKVAIKEYFPRELAARESLTGQVFPVSDTAKQPFQAGLNRFLDEARTLAKFQQHPGIVSVLSFFPALGTGYMVMEYVEGETLKNYLNQRGRLDWHHTLDIFMQIMDALRAVHQVGLLHRDIAPDNIYLCRDGRIKLLDFGAALFSGRSLNVNTSSLTVVLKPGFAPEEQYSDSGDQGPWTDIYSVAASMYFCLTGQTPPDARDRLMQDELQPPSKYGVMLPAGAEQVLLNALAVDSLQRPQSMESLQNQFLKIRQAEAPIEPYSIKQAIQEPDSGFLLEAKRSPRLDFFRRRSLLIIVISALLLASIFERCQHQEAKQASTMFEENAIHQPSDTPKYPDNAEEDRVLLREEARQAAEDLKQQQAAALKRFEEMQQDETPSARQSQRDDPRQLEHLRSICEEWGATMDCKGLQ